jgi:hypothetical protein
MIDEMDVKLTQPAEIAIRTLPDGERRRLMSWLDRLKDWPTDESVNSSVRRLPSHNGEDLYVLRVGGELRLAFALRDDVISVLDVFRRDALDAFRQPAR